MQDKLSEILNRLFRDSEYKLIELVIRGEKNTKVLEVFVDSRETLSIDKLTDLNRAINEAIDNDDEDFRFSKIVVSSPGVDRSFKYIWQLYKHEGRNLELELNDETHTILKGKLLGIIDESVLELEELKTMNKGNLQLTGNIRRINFSDIKNSKVIISFKP